LLNQERILYEDNHLIAVNKTNSELVQGDKTGDRTLADEVRDFIKARDHKPGNVFLGICHRLDRPTSGVVVFAKTGKALSRMNGLFREDLVSKTYWAVTAGAPPGETSSGTHSGTLSGTHSGTLIHFLKKNESQNKSYVVKEGTPGARRAELCYEVLAESDRYVLVKVMPKTGRHHQIRVQLSVIGCPIRGDLKYGFPRSDPGGGIHLHARTIEFAHPVSNTPVEITAPVPEEKLWLVLEEAARSSPLEG